MSGPNAALVAPWDYRPCPLCGEPMARRSQRCRACRHTGAAPRSGRGVRTDLWDAWYESGQPQRDIAAALGISRALLTDWFSGRVHASAAQRQAFRAALAALPPRPTKPAPVVPAQAQRSTAGLRDTRPVFETWGFVPDADRLDGLPRPRRVMAEYERVCLACGRPCSDRTMQRCPTCRGSLVLEAA